MGGVCWSLKSSLGLVGVTCSRKSAPWCLPYKLDSNVLPELPGRSVAMTPPPCVPLAETKPKAYVSSNKLLAKLLRANGY